MSVLTRPAGRHRGVDPRTPHQFRCIDAIAATGVGSGYGMQQGTQQAALFALMADAARGRCRVPGCGKPPEDPIHA